MMPRSFAPCLLLLLSALLSACTPHPAPRSQVSLPTPPGPASNRTLFAAADGSRPLRFPEDFGAHPDFRSEWWYYTGNLEDTTGQHFGFELTIFRVALLPGTPEPSSSAWATRQVYFAHFALSDIPAGQFRAYERFSRPGPGLAGARAQPYRVWLEDWSIRQEAERTYRLDAAADDIALTLHLEDSLGPVLHGEMGYSRKGASPSNASYYYSLPQLQAQGTLQTAGGSFSVRGLVWMDHEFSTSALDADERGWDWFALQFEDGSALMLYQIRRNDGGYSPWSSGTLIAPDGTARHLTAQDFRIQVLDTWHSPHTGAQYPAQWQVQVPSAALQVEITPWMADQELNLPPTAYWEGAVRVSGTHPGSGYVELTGYAP